MRKIMGGVNVWPPMSVDVERGLVFLPTGSATVDPYGTHRNAPIPYAGAVVAIKGDTGEPVWHYQIVHHDLWDYDLPSQPIAVDIRKDGKTIPVIIQMNKMGLTFVFHRETGEPVFPIEERPVPQSDIPGERSSPTQPFPTAFEPLTITEFNAEDVWGVTPWERESCREKVASYRSDGMFTPPSTKGSVTMPNGYGGVNWGNAAYVPYKNLLIVNATQLASVSYLLPRGDSREVSLTDHSKGSSVGGPLEDTPYAFLQTPILSPIGAPCTPPPWGTMTAIDMGTGKTVWKIPFGAVPVPFASWFSTPEDWGSPLIGGPMATAGGLVFAGASLDATIRAVDMATGEIVWDEDLPAPGNATPMTYEYKGKQYVVIAAGGNAVAGTKLGDSVVAFALDD
jgi:quinoprotein glucose dehydrogenase